MNRCDGDSDDCTGMGTFRCYPEQGQGLNGWLCRACHEAYERWMDHYDPPDPDGEDMFRDYQSEQRDQAAAAWGLK